MLLTIDVGNTNMVFGIFDGEELSGSIRLKTDSIRTSDEIGILVCEYFSRFGLNPDDVEDVIIASVVPQVMYSLTSAIKKYFNKTPIIIDDDVDPGLTYEGDERLGADRSVAAVAAIEKYGAPLIIIDFGTATTVDAIAPDGTYLGGVINAGLGVTLDALISKAALLPRVELNMVDNMLGYNTVTQIQGGVVGGYVGSIEYIVDHMEKDMGCGEVKCVATGGLARLISDNTDRVDVVDPQLVLDGLRFIYKKYKEEQK